MDWTLNMKNLVANERSEITFFQLVFLCSIRTVMELKLLYKAFHSSPHQLNAFSLFFFIPLAMTHLISTYLAHNKENLWNIFFFFEPNSKFKNHWTIKIYDMLIFFSAVEMKKDVKNCKQIEGGKRWMWNECENMKMINKMMEGKENWKGISINKRWEKKLH